MAAWTMADVADDPLKRVDEADALHAALQTLSWRERRVLEFRYGLRPWETQQRAHTLREIGRFLNCSAESVRRVEGIALNKLAAQLGPRGT